MAGLEKIIRPFETRSISPINLPPTDNSTPPQNIILTYGRNSSSGGGGTSSRSAASTTANSGGATATSGHYENNVTCYMTKQEKESSQSDPLGLRGFKTGHV